MPSFRNNGRRIGLTPAALVLLCAFPAAAQLGQPIQLLPPAPGTEQPRMKPAGARAPNRAAPALVAPSPSDDAIRASPLAPVDAAWAGSLGQAEGALRPDMWRGSQRSAVAAMLPLLAPTTSPVLQDLARRLLLSDAAAPAGSDPADRPGLAALRFERLAALGEVAGALAIVDQLPKPAQPEALERRRVELRFAANDADGACREVPERIARYQNPWWDRTLIACQALAGDHAKAALGLSLLREQRAPRDTAFDMLVETLGGRKHKIDKLPEPTPIAVALLAATKQPLPADALAKASPAVLRQWASDETIPASQRLAAAERASLLGVLPPAALAALYDKIEFKPEEQAAALKDGKPPQDARGHALLYETARDAQAPATRMAALAPLLADARKHGSFFVAARLAAPLIGDLEPANEPEGFAADAARALLAAGEPDAAQRWIAASGAKELAAVSRIAKPGEDDPAPLLNDAIAQLAARDSAASQHQADLLVALFAALGETVGGVDWAPLLAPPHEAALPSAVLWTDQQQASADKRLGETVLATLLVAGGGEHLSSEPIVLSRAIAGLRAVGLDADARRLAVEAALGAGI